MPACATVTEQAQFPLLTSSAAMLWLKLLITTSYWRYKKGAPTRRGTQLGYATSYPSHYYYAFLCLLVLLFYERPNALASLVPLSMLLLFNVAALITDSYSPSPIAFYTLANGYLFVCVAGLLGFELYDLYRPRAA